MHVAHVVDTLQTGGAQKLLVTFAEQAKRKHVDVTVISLREKTRYHSIIPMELEEAGARVSYFPIRKILDPIRFLQFVSFLKKGQYDVLHAHLLTSNIFGGFAGRLARIPAVVTLHSIGKDPRYENFWRDQLELMVLRKVNRVIAVGESVSDVYTPLLHRELDVIPNAVNDRVLLSDDERMTFRKELTGDPLRPMLISVGSLSPDKCFDDLLVAFSIARSCVPNLALVIAGDGLERERLFSKCQSLGLDEHVFWLGVRSDIPRLLAACDIYISSSGREGLAIAMLEAMMAGLPVIVTSVGEAPLVVSNERGVLVSPHDPVALSDAILHLLSDTDFQSVLGNKARDYVQKNFHADAWFDRIYDLYMDELRVANGV